MVVACLVASTNHATATSDGPGELVPMAYPTSRAQSSDQAQVDVPIEVEPAGPAESQAVEMPKTSESKTCACAANKEASAEKSADQSTGRPVAAWANKSSKKEVVFAPLLEGGVEGIAKAKPVAVESKKKVKKAEKTTAGGDQEEPQEVVAAVVSVEQGGEENVAWSKKENKSKAKDKKYRSEGKRSKRDTKRSKKSGKERRGVEKKRGKGSKERK